MYPFSYWKSCHDNLVLKKLKKLNTWYSQETAESRQYNVVMNGKKSCWAYMLSGIPQGSVVGPILLCWNVCRCHEIWIHCSMTLTAYVTGQWQQRFNAAKYDLMEALEQYSFGHWKYHFFYYIASCRKKTYKNDYPILRRVPSFVFTIIYSFKGAYRAYTRYVNNMQEMFYTQIFARGCFSWN